MLYIATISFLSTIALAQQAITFPKGGETFTVGQSITVTWVAQTSALPLVTLVLWDADPDGVYYTQTGYENFPNTGQVQWIVPNNVGQRRLGIGVGNPGALTNASSSFIFNIQQAPTSTTPTSTSSSISNSAAASSAQLTSTGTSTSTSGTAPPASATIPTGLSPGAVGGIAGGIVGFFLLLGAFAAWWFRRRWRVNFTFVAPSGVDGWQKGEQDTGGRVNEHPLQYPDDNLPGARVHDL